jgi:hypothetical protein
VSGTPLTRALEYACECLDRAEALLNEVDTIGLWVKSDDSSDNRRKRTALRETDWTLSGAVRRIDGVLPGVPAVRVVLTELRDELRKLVAAVEPLPDLVTDTMDKNPELDDCVRRLREEIARVRERAGVVLGKSRV